MTESEEKKLLLEKLKLENWALKEKIIKGFAKDLGIPVLAILFGVSVLLNGGNITLKLFDQGKFSPSVAVEAAGEEALEEEIAMLELEGLGEGGGGGGGILPKRTPRLLKDRIKKRNIKKMSKKYSAKPKTVSKVNYVGLVFSLLCLIGIFIVYRWKKKEKQKEVVV